VTITVIICTYNRCQSLAKTLESVAVSVLPDAVEWEVLVVNNNSNDQTRQVVEDFCRRYPGRFRYLFEPHQGLSYARNAGIREARSSILAFTDDDATVEPNWLCNLTAELLAGACTGAGGRIVPVWGKAVPSWLSTNDPQAMSPFVAFDLGENAGPLTRPPYGANMAFRTEAFKRHGGFRVDLGRSGINLQGREEIQFANRLLAAGERLRYEPDAVVRHPVPEGRMKKRYVLRWWYWYGRSEVAEAGPPDARWLLGGVPLCLFRRLARWGLQAMVSTSAPRRFSCMCNVWYLAGTMMACYRWRRHNQHRGSADRLRGTQPERSASQPGTPI